jgi:hypothetical protein
VIGVAMAERETIFELLRGALGPVDEQ